MARHLAEALRAHIRGSIARGARICEPGRSGARGSAVVSWTLHSNPLRNMASLWSPCLCGSTPRMLFEFLASDDFRGQVDWAKVHVFCGAMSALHSSGKPRESNYGMARRELLLRVVPIPQGQCATHGSRESGTSDAPPTTTRKSCENIWNSMIVVSSRFHLILLAAWAPTGIPRPLFPGTRSDHVKRRAG